jgi:hypothetical protein
MIENRIHQWLSGFGLSDFLRQHLMVVMGALPQAVRDDLMEDPQFRLFDYEPGHGVVMQVPVGSPRVGAPGRAVVLKRTLRHRPESFVRYIIAHELAHAHLRNTGRWPGEDPEQAADSLAADWGYPRP